MTFVTVNSKVQRARRAVRGGREYLVAPASLIVPGVLPGSRGPLYYPPEEVGRNPADWDGIPLVVYHPTRNGRNVSASHPGVVEESGVGFVQASRYGRLSSGGKERLGAEAWFDVEKTRAYDARLAENGVAPVLPRLERGEPVEISTGLFLDTEAVSAGAVDPVSGRPYSYVARNYRPDHLAVLPDQVGACSVKDGCGLLVNRRAERGPVWSPVRNADPVADFRGRLASVGKWLEKNGLMPGYGQVFYLPDAPDALESGKVWYVGGDGDDWLERNLPVKKFGAVSGVSKVVYEAESFPPKDEGWIQVYPRARDWVSVRNAGFFTECERDDRGRCVAGSGGKAGGSVSAVAKPSGAKVGRPNTVPTARPATTRKAAESAKATAQSSSTVRSLAKTLLKPVAQFGRDFKENTAIGLHNTFVRPVKNVVDRHAREDAKAVVKGLFSRMTLGTGPLIVKAASIGVKHSPKAFRLLAKGMAAITRAAGRLTGASAGGSVRSRTVAPGTKVHSVNAFCPTGKGGGQDNSCGSRKNSGKKGGDGVSQTFSGYREIQDAADKFKIGRKVVVKRLNRDGVEETIRGTIKSLFKVKTVAGRKLESFGLTYGDRLSTSINLGDHDLRSITINDFWPGRLSTAYRAPLTLATNAELDQDALMEGLGYLEQMRQLLDDDPEEADRFFEACKAVMEELGDDDEPEGNAFCPTGEGGGIDPTCGKGSGKGRSKGSAATPRKVPAADTGKVRIQAAQDKVDRINVRVAKAKQTLASLQADLKVSKAELAAVKAEVKKIIAASRPARKRNPPKAKKAVAV